MHRALKEFYRFRPHGLEAHFEGVAALKKKRSPDEPAGLLSIEQAATLTTVLRGLNPVIDAIDGFILDDCQGNGHHVYVGHSFFAGSVLYLGPIGATRIVFPTLDDYWCALLEAHAADQSLTDHHPTLAPLASRQETLNELMREHLKSERGTPIIRALLPSSSLSDHSLVRRLVRNRDHDLAEAVAAEICKRPSQALRWAAELCIEHSHSQVVTAGLRALDVISAGRVR